MLAGYSKGSGSLAIGPGTKLHPVGSWWWRGLPATPANAVVLGADYQRLWPDFAARAELIDGLAFLDGMDWRGKADDGFYPGPIPCGLTQRDQPQTTYPLTLNAPPTDRDLYAEVWPFEGPFKVD
jgi:hypothetical protein